MAKWEYSVKAESAQPELMNMLNRMGDEGWEVMKMDIMTSAGGALVYFKRLKEDVAKPTLLTD